MSTRSVKRFLASYVDAYLGAAAEMSLAELRERQPPPHASLAFGGAGIAYMFFRAYEAGKGAAYLAEAKRWSSATWRARARSDAWRGVIMQAGHAGGAELDPPSSSFAFGRAGLSFVEALVESPRTRADRIGDLIDLSRLGKAATVDFMDGVAGRLAALATLYSRHPEPRVKVVGNRLATWLVAAPPPDYGPWFAYGSLGAFHAVMRWSTVSGFDLPGRWLDQLDAIAGKPIPYRQIALDRSWCNGSAGVALAFVTAYERTSRSLYLDAARAATHHAIADAPGSSGVCCGLAGRAYAALALHRVAPDKALVSRAGDLAIAAIQGPALEYPNSLLRGHPGMVCLALDLTTKHPAGHPRFPITET
ncbi:MAG TPA: lanthionine synthetase LanC family protein [Kofleriaceae bacterium]